jgi:putative ABC transport system ATP-binding protein
VSASQPVLSLTDVTKTYSMGDITVPALNGVSLEVQEGEMLAIMGPSGSGKSTLMNILGCLDQPTSGKYWLAGDLVSSLNDQELAAVRNRQIGFVFQSFNLLRRTTALNNVELPLRYGGKATQGTGLAKAALERVGLGHRLKHHSTELSGGEQQRVSIARALVMSPSIILADEPTGNLDTRTSHEIMGLLQELNQKDGVLVVIVTHEQNISEHCERVISIRDGEIVSDGPMASRRWAMQPEAGGAS